MSCQSRCVPALFSGLVSVCLVLGASCRDEDATPVNVALPPPAVDAGARTDVPGSTSRDAGGLAEIDGQAEPPEGEAPDAGASGDAVVGDGGVPPIVVRYLDRAANPCDDFFKFACGTFETLYPPGMGVGISYRANASARANNFTKTIITAAVAAAPTSTDPEVLTIANYNQSCLEADTQPASRMTLKGVVDMVDAIKSVADWTTVGAELRRRGVSTLLVIYPLIDPGLSSAYVLTLDQGARKLPNRDYYFQPGFQAIRDRYLVHIKTLAGLVGVTIDPAAVMRVETALANSELGPVEKRDPVAIYNKMPFAAAAALAPHLALRAHLDALGYGPLQSLNVVSPAALKGLDTLLATLPIEDLKHYLRWQIVESKANLLDHDPLIEEFEFHDRLFNGVTVMPSRQSTCQTLTASRFTNVFARTFVETYFPQEARDRSTALLMSLRAAFARRLQTRTWLDPATRTEALAKLEALVAKVGGPMPLPTITKVTPKTPLLEQNLQSTVDGYGGNITVLTTTPDRRRWVASPMTVNAYYEPWYNDIVVPAAILQSPFFDAHRPDAANYAMIGALMGHELSHGFDDRGRLYDSTGNLRDWWTAAAKDEFAKRASCFGDAMGKFEAVPGKAVNGALTLSEHLADSNGLRLAYDAFEHDGVPGADFEGFNPRQQFFIASAQIRCSTFQTAYIEQLIATDPHPPDKARVVVPISLMPEFAQAFNCPVGAKERAPVSCEMW